MTGYAIGAICQGTVSAIRRAPTRARRAPPALRPRAHRDDRCRYRHRSNVHAAVHQLADRAIHSDPCPGNPPQAAIVIIGTLLTCVVFLTWHADFAHWSWSRAHSAQRTSWPFGVRTVLVAPTVFAGVVVLAAAGLSVSMVFFQQSQRPTAGQSASHISAT